MNRSRVMLSLVLCGAAGLATAQMTPNGSAQPTMPGQSPGMGQPGRPGTLGGEIPSTAGGQTDTQKTPTPKVDDATLERDVKQQLASDPAFAMVRVSAHNGRVELTGSVSIKDDRKKAKEMAKSVPGVSSVKEHLTVGGGSTSTSDANQNTAGSISGNAQKSDADSANKNATPSSTIPDTAPQTANPPHPTPPDANPQSALPPNDTTPHASRLISASYQEGSNAHEAMPSQQAGQNSGAAQNNGTPVNATLTRDNTDNGAVQSQIENALRNEPALTATHVGVSVTDTAIELSGTVGSSKDKLAAERIAQSFGANRKLSDKLTVTGHGHSDMAQDHPAMNNSGTSTAADQNPPQPR